MTSQSLRFLRKWIPQLKQADSLFVNEGFLGLSEKDLYSKSSPRRVRGESVRQS